MRPISSLLAAAALMLPAGALAQTPAQAPVREGNVWDNKDHQPTRGEMKQEEDAAGLRGTAAQQQQEDNTLKQLDQQILQRAQQDLKGAGAGTQPGQ